MDDYGYKLCYKKRGKEKLKIYIITNSYDLAEFHIRWYAKHGPPDKTLSDVTWLIVPIKTYAEYKRLWRDCPF
jgi:hypothetical protein